ncbi:hypothetical protein GCM10020331_047210 [Ectobacillus funiculus]
MYIVRVQLRKTENENVMQQFLQSHPEFEWDISMKERLPKALEPYTHDGQVQIFAALLCDRRIFILLVCEGRCDNMETTVAKKETKQEKQAVHLFLAAA